MVPWDLVALSLSIVDMKNLSITCQNGKNILDSFVGF